MILPSAVSDWSCRTSREEGCRPGHSLARPAGAGDARECLQPVINHNCFNSINDVFACRWNASDKYMISLEYIHRGFGSRRGQKQAPDLLPRAIAMPCVYSPRWNLQPRPDADARYAAPGARRFRRAAGFGAAPDT